jgi:hypothetical protein
MCGSTWARTVPTSVSRGSLALRGTIRGSARGDRRGNKPRPYHPCDGIIRVITGVYFSAG